MPRAALIFGACLAAIAAAVVVIDVTGGLPSQLAHIYYLPVVVAALLLPRRLSLMVTFMAGLAVSPVPDLVHGPLGMDLYYPDPAPWRIGSGGWIARPIAFLAVNLIISSLTERAGERLAAERRAREATASLRLERSGRELAEAASASRARELETLHSIDTMILSGTSEDEALQEIVRLVSAVTGAHFAAIAKAEPAEGGRRQTIIGYSASGPNAGVAQVEMPFGEGVGGWALQHGSTTVSPNVFEDPRYDKMADFARSAGYASAAAAPIKLDDQVIAALTIGHRAPRAFTEDEISTLERIAAQTAIAVSNARQRQSLAALAHETATALSDVIESRDPYTGGHCNRLAEYSRITASALGLSRRKVEVVRFGAALHDVGKIVVPDAILKKPDKLTPDEYAIIKQHAYHGGQICKRVSFLQSAYPIVYHHHERWDGRGYPDGLKGEKIPLGARIVAVSDAFDAMTTDRPYRNAMPDDEAVAILRDGAGSQWDPRIVEAFLRATGLTPAGYSATRVTLGPTR